MNMERSEQPIVGDVDTHKDLHVAAVVDAQDQFIASESFATTRQGYRLMLEWMKPLLGPLPKYAREPWCYRCCSGHCQR